mmetsp:Transcript_85958/g.248201  ORF Transcript_85958/g.248201 Transcript_85958/m.248201 type:complete len:261 (-) Transcript_85958:626-1408(-)
MSSGISDWTWPSCASGLATTCTTLVPRADTSPSVGVSDTSKADAIGSGSCHLKSAAMSESLRSSTSNGADATFVYVTGNRTSCVDIRKLGSWTSAKVSMNCARLESKPSTRNSARNFPTDPARSVTMTSAVRPGHTMRQSGSERRLTESARVFAASPVALAPGGALPLRSIHALAARTHGAPDALGALPLIRRTVLVDELPLRALLRKASTTSWWDSTGKTAGPAPSHSSWPEIRASNGMSEGLLIRIATVCRACARTTP